MQIQEIVTPEAIQEAMRVYLQGARDIREEAESGMMRQQHNLAVLYGLGLGVPLTTKRHLNGTRKQQTKVCPNHNSTWPLPTKMEWVHAKIW